MSSIHRGQAKAWERIHDQAVELGWWDEYHKGEEVGLHQQTWIDWLLVKMQHLHLVNLLTEKKETEKAQNTASQRQSRNKKAWEVILRGNGDFNVEYKD